MKTKKLITLEKYSVVAVRAKVSVEVEQRKRLGTWAKRVLVLDGATLYAYKTKGDGGSVGGWAVGGADVYVARGSDSTRDDGRHILVVSRPPAYKLTFSFNTTYEQARLIQALSSSGATVTGLDAIMLLKDLRKQQEEERKDEERKKQIKEQTGALEERREPNSTSTSLERVAEYAGQDDRKAEEDEEEEDEDEEDLTIKREKNIDDEDEEDEEEPGKNINTIYDISTGVVNNPLYSSNVNLSSSDGESDAPATKETFLFTYSRSSSNSEVPVALLTEVSVTNQRSNENVNPLPKPPRAVFDEPRSSADSQSPSLEDGSPVTVDGSPREVTDNPSEAGDNDNPTEVGSNPSVLDSILAEVSSSFELDSNSVAVCGILAGVDSSPTEVSSGPIVVDGSSAEVDNSSTETDEKQKEQLSFISGKYEDVIFKLEEKECVSSSESLLSSDSFKEVITGENEMVSEAINLLHSNTESSKEGEGLSQVESKPEKHDFQDEFDEKINITIENGKNSDVLSENGLVSGDTFKTEPTEESLNESCAHQPVKMKLERYFYIDCEAPPPDTDSLDLYQRNSCDSHLDSPSSSSSYPSSSGECGSNKEESASEQNKSQVKYEDTINQESKESEIHIKNVIHDVHSDTEKIEQIYNELNNNTQGELQTESYKEHEIPVSPVNEILENIEELGDENSLQVSPDNVMKENGHIEGEDLVDFPIGSHGEQQPLRRVNSIIKKKGSSSSSTGSVKRVQFNLDIKSETPPPSVASEPSVSTAATAEKSDDTRSASARKPESCSDTRTLGSSKSPTSPKARKETSGTTTGSKKMDKKTSSASLGFPSKKKGSSDTTSSSPPSKKTPDSSLTSSAKKKTFEPSSTSSPSKKKGIFSSIFSGSSKRADSLVTREDAETKKKSSETSSVSLKRYQTVDLNAPIIISGQAEVGVSMNRLNSRRVEVRDGHVLSFLPRATTPTSRISLVGLSVAPVLGAAHAHALTLTRAARCMMVIKLGSREEMMRWIHTLSDEVIKVTPEDQQAGLILYPSPPVKGQKEEVVVKEEEDREVKENEKEEENNGDEQKEQEQKNEEEEEEKEQDIENELDKKLEQEGDNILRDEKEEEKKPENDIEQETETEVHQDLGESRKDLAVESEITNGCLEAAGDESPVNKKQENQDDGDGEHLGNICRATDKTLEQGGDCVDGLQSVSSEGKLSEIKDLQKQDDSDENDCKSISNDRRESTKSESEIQRKIQLFSQGDRSMEQNKGVTKGKHPPLRRLSGETKASSQPDDKGTDTVDNFLIVSNLPGYPTNISRPTRQLSVFSRIISASDSSLRTTITSRADTNLFEMQTFGSDALSHKNSSDKRREKMRTQDRILPRGPGSHTSIIESTPHLERRASQSRSSSHSLSSRYLFNEPRPIEIIENTDNKYNSGNDISGANERHLNNRSKHCYKDDLSASNAPVKDNIGDLQRITWSVAATREKFELLCSVSGENKGGRLTTKTPISRKRTSRGTLKKRSLEGASSRRSTLRRGAKKSSFGDDNYNSQEMHGDSSDANVDHLLQQKPLRLQPVKDLKKNFELDISRNLCSKAIRTPSTELSNDPLAARKSPLSKTANVLQQPYSRSSSPSSSSEAKVLTSRSVNVRPSGVGLTRCKDMPQHPSSSESSRPSSVQNNDVVICWRGPYIAQSTEQAVLANISNAFLAKRRLLTREVAEARIQERLSSLEEKLWHLQSSMADMNINNLGSNNTPKEMKKWTSLQESLSGVEEEITYWTSRLAQTQKEAEEARQKLATALATGFSQQYSPGPGSQDRKPKYSISKKKHRRTLLDDENDDSSELDVSEA